LTALEKVNTFTFVKPVPVPPQDRALRSRLRLLESATTLFAEQGFDATSIKDVAREAGLSVGLVCRYFPTREHLALAIYDRLADDLMAASLELQTGTVAARFTELMRFRIEQCQAHRRPLTALLGPALDPESALYALGPTTEPTRAKVHGALGVVLAGATDAPKTQLELSRQAQLLYTIHLGLVLATLAQSDARKAHAAAEQAGMALGLLQLPVVGEHVASLLLDRPRAHTHDDAATAREILERLFRDSRVLPGVAPGLSAASEALHRPRVEAAVRNQQPIELVLPAFPAKAPNLHKVLGSLPDLAELRAIERLSELLNEIAAVYKPGARLTICSDGHVFADAVGVKDVVVDQYRDALLSMVDDPRIRWFDLTTAFGEDVPAADLRAHLMRKYATSESALKERATRSPAVAAQIDGIHRFLYDDEIVLHPEVSKSQSKKKTRPLAYEVVRRSEAWGALVADVFPQALRLSIHPQPDPSTKIGINLLGVRDPWLTPWHGVAVVGRDGTTLMHRHEAEALGAVIVEEAGRPSHMELL
jgi:pyoverdine/dityrosine biosynthesis protein Dit1/AcrR family transcriptional regulator